MHRKHSLKYFQMACVTGFLLVLILMALKDRMLVTEEYQGRAFRNYQVDLLAPYLIFTVGICLLIFGWGKIKNPKLEKVLALVSLAFMPVVNFYMFETVVDNFKTIVANSKEIVLINIGIWYLLYISVFVICNSVKITVLLLNVLTYVLALANAFVVQFRGHPIMIMDIKTFRTAVSVAGEYEYIFTVNMINMALLLILCILWVLKLEYRFRKWKIRLGCTTLAVVGVSVSLYGLMSGSVLEKAGLVQLDFFRFNESYKNYGYMACTLKTLEYLRVEEPENYSVEQVKRIADEVVLEDKSQQELPENVIVIMNEAFSDLSVLGEFATEEPVLEFFDGLQGENVRKGNLHVSVVGGGTASTEFEFLTGNSMAYLPTGAIAYQMYVEEGDSSIVSQFKENGYKSVVIHPHRKENYNRPKVYELYGFDEYLAKDDLKFKKIRKFASDASIYQKIIKMCEEKEAGEKLFVFNITMQNHSGYDYEKFKDAIALTEYPGQFPQTEQYLGLLKKSDEALKDLTEYFANSDEKTVILFFGDHQPNLEDGFRDYIVDVSQKNDTMEKAKKQHITPYLLWANYPLNIETEPDMSVNYLGSYLLEAIGMDQPLYNRYLSGLRERIPVINYFGFMDRSGLMHWNEQAGAYEELLTEYEMFQYNNLFDDSHRLHDLYE